MQTDPAQEKPLHEKLEFAISLIKTAKTNLRGIGNVDDDLQMQIHNDLQHAVFILLGQANNLRREQGLEPLKNTTVIKAIKRVQPNSGRHFPAKSLCKRLSESNVATW